MPSYPSNEDDGAIHNDYEIAFFWEKRVYDFAGISFQEQDDLPYNVWLQLRYDAFIYHMNQSEKGREYLDNAWMLTQTEPIVPS